MNETTKEQSFDEMREALQVLSERYFLISRAHEKTLKELELLQIDFDDLKREFEDKVGFEPSDV